MSVPTALERMAAGGMAGASALVLAMDIDPGIENQFNAWYTHEHLHDRVGLPGFLRGTRWMRPDGAPAHRQKYLTIYEAASSSAFTSVDYLTSLNNPTPWTQRMVPAFQNSMRTVADILGSAGTVIGREMSIVEFRADDQAQLLTWFTDVAVPEALSQPDCCGIHLLAPDPASTMAKATTSEGKSVEDELSQLMLILHGTQGTEDMLHRVAAGRPAGLRTEPAGEIATYTFYCTLIG